MRVLDKNSIMSHHHTCVCVCCAIAYLFFFVVHKFLSHTRTHKYFFDFCLWFKVAVFDDLQRNTWTIIIQLFSKWNTYTLFFFFSEYTVELKSIQSNKRRHWKCETIFTPPWNYSGNLEIKTHKIKKHKFRNFIFKSTIIFFCLCYTCMYMHMYTCTCTTHERPAKWIFLDPTWAGRKDFMTGSPSLNSKLI